MTVPDGGAAVARSALASGGREVAAGFEGLVVDGGLGRFGVGDGGEGLVAAR